MSEDRKFLMFVCAVVFGTAVAFAGAAFDVRSWGFCAAMATLAASAMIIAAIAWLEPRP